MKNRPQNSWTDIYCTQAGNGSATTDHFCAALKALAELNFLSFAFPLSFDDCEKLILKYMEELPEKQN